MFYVAPSGHWKSCGKWQKGKSNGRKWEGEKKKQISAE